MVIYQNKEGPHVAALQINHRTSDYLRHEVGRYFASTLDFVQVQEIDPALVMGERTKVSPVIFLFASLPNVAVITPPAAATLVTYLPEIDPSLARPTLAFFAFVRSPRFE
jgi:hypothetical protein